MHLGLARHPGTVPHLRCAQTGPQQQLGILAAVRPSMLAPVPVTTAHTTAMLPNQHPSQHAPDTLLYTPLLLAHSFSALSVTRNASWSVPAWRHTTAAAATTCRRGMSELAFVRTSPLHCTNTATNHEQADAHHPAASSALAPAFAPSTPSPAGNTMQVTVPAGACCSSLPLPPQYARVRACSTIFSSESVTLQPLRERTLCSSVLRRVLMLEMSRLSSTMGLDSRAYSRSIWMPENCSTARHGTQTATGW